MDYKADDTLISTPTDTELTLASDIAQIIPTGLAVVIQQKLADLPLRMFPGEHIGYAELEDSLHNLATNATFSFEEYDQSLNDLIGQNADTLLKAQKAKATQGVTRRNQVAVIDQETGEPVWKTIPAEIAPRFADAIADAKLEPEDHPILTQESPDLFDGSALDEFLPNIDYELINCTAELMAVVPTVTEIANGQADGLRVSPGPTMNGMHTIGLEFLPHSRTLTTIRKKVMRLVKEIDDFTANPSAEAARQTYEVNQTAITEELTEIVEATLLRATTTLYESLSPQELTKTKQLTRETEEPKLSKRQKRRLKQLANLAIQDTVEDTTEAEAQTDSERVIEDVTLSLPWLDDGEPTQINVRERSNGQNSVYIINGMEYKLQKIANETLDKGVFEDKVDGAITNQANLLLAGYMPWDRQSSAIKSVTKDSKAPRAYQDEFIWYTYDLRPNAPRVYFIVKDAAEIEASDTPVLQPGTKCLVVVGITDKSRQLDVLRRFTGKNRTALINEGAGSI